MVLGFPESSLNGKLFEVIYEQDVAVWPDGRIKSSPMFSKVAKMSHSSFNFRIADF